LKRLCSIALILSALSAPAVCAGPGTAVAAGGSPPEKPVLLAPADGSAVEGGGAVLEALVDDPDDGSLTVRFFGRKVAAGEDDPFSIVFIPDTQHYTAALYGGAPWMFVEQIEWTVEHASELGVGFVVHAGDVVQYGDYDVEAWQAAWGAMSLLEDPLATGREEGIPYSVCVGNHDLSPEDDPDGTTTWYNTFYGPEHLGKYSWYGGHFGPDGDNHFTLFSAGGRRFISISLEYDTSPDAGVLAWADSLLSAHRDRLGIVCSHYILETGDPAAFSWQGGRIYLALYDNPNLFLMLSGHVPGEGRWSARLGERWIHALMADYQSRPNGGNGWMRLITFHPSSSLMRVRTWSPVLGIYEADADSSSQFVLPVDLSGGFAWIPAGTSEGVIAGTAAETLWSGLEPGAEYEWYVEVDDGSSSVSSDRRRFTVEDRQDEVTGGLSMELSPGNPFRDIVSFRVRLPEPSFVRLSVYDIRGRLVSVIVSDGLPEGDHDLVWDASAGASVTAPGVYFALLEACGEAVSSKIVIVR